MSNKLYKVANVAQGLASADSATLVGDRYAVRIATVLVGYVQRQEPRGWVAWNSHGDMWRSFAATRDAAADAMLAAGWREFQRAPARAPIEA